MKLTTEIPLKAQENKIDYASQVVLLGSCFSENIGAKFDFYKFQNLQNPFGIIFNPVALERLIVRAVDNIFFSEEDIFQHNGLWRCFEVHSELSSLDKSEYLTNLNTSLKKLRESLCSATHIIFTFGTSWVYRYVGTSATISDRTATSFDGSKSEIVANCHKLAQKNFKKELLSVEAILNSIQNISEKINAVNKGAQLIFTVSPVRHIKDGFAENSLSKAHLISAIHQSLSLREQTKSVYFPSFEIMVDELRDYRFYAKDLLHPNTTAIEIIWQKFSAVWIASKCAATQKEIAAIQNGLNHKPFNPKSDEHLQFLKILQQKIDAIEARFPHIEF